jgi:hypothetical protein
MTWPTRSGSAGTACSDAPLRRIVSSPTTWPSHSVLATTRLLYICTMSLGTAFVTTTHTPVPTPFATRAPPTTDLAVGGHVICPKQPSNTKQHTPGISRHSTKFHSVHTLHTAIASAHRVCLRRAPSRAHARPGRERTTERNQSKKQQSPPHVHAQSASLSYLHVLMTFFCCMNYFHASTQAPRERVPAGAQAPTGHRPPGHQRTNAPPVGHTSFHSTHRCRRLRAQTHLLRMFLTTTRSIQHSSQADQGADQRAPRTLLSSLVSSLCHPACLDKALWPVVVFGPR